MQTLKKLFNEWLPIKNFSHVFLENGKIYSCGRNTDGQLGIGDNDTLDYAALPMFVTEIEDEIVQITAGSHHSLLLTGETTIKLKEGYSTYIQSGGAGLEEKFRGNFLKKF